MPAMQALEKDQNVSLGNGIVTVLDGAVASTNVIISEKPKPPKQAEVIS